MKSRGSGGAPKAGGSKGGSSSQGGSSKQGARSGSSARGATRPGGAIGGGLLGGVIGAAKAGDGGPSVRRQRLAGAIHKHISSELGRHLADPRLATVGIERVELSPDLSIAKVYVRIMFGDAGPAAQRAALAALAGAGPGLRSSLGPLLRMRRVPELRFHYDVGAEKRAHIEGILAEIAHEDEAKRSQLIEQGASDDEPDDEADSDSDDEADSDSDDEPDDDEADSDSDDEPDDDEE